MNNKWNGLVLNTEGSAAPSSLFYLSLSLVQLYVLAIFYSELNSKILYIFFKCVKSLKLPILQILRLVIKLSLNSKRYIRRINVNFILLDLVIYNFCCAYKSLLEK